MSRMVLKPFAGSYKGPFPLPRSKSISNRLLIMQALSQGWVQPEGLSDALDTLELQKCLQNPTGDVFAGNGGTTARFLLAYLSLTPGIKTLTAGPQMQQRTVAPLVDCLRQLGADIHYLDTEGCLPVRITGGQLTGHIVNIDAGISSQFVSALMLIGPYLPAGLTLQLGESVVSQSYLKMTAGLMKQAGAELNITSLTIHISPQVYGHRVIEAEYDWSAAAFAYELAALSAEPDVFIPGLTPSTLQGDALIADIFHYFKVKSTFEAHGLRLTKGKERTPRQRINLKSFPDMAPAMVVTCAALGIEAEIWGIQHLQYKESNRIQALQDNLMQMGLDMVHDGDTLWCRGIAKPGTYTITTCNDHRIAMAFAPLVLKGFTLDIDDKDCVSKSFPSFWDNLMQAGFDLSAE